jgi:hypothetical protein
MATMNVHNPTFTNGGMLAGTGAATVQMREADRAHGALTVTLFFNDAEEVEAAIAALTSTRIALTVHAVQSGRYDRAIYGQDV